MKTFHLSFLFKKKIRKTTKYRVFHKKKYILMTYFFFYFCFLQTYMLDFRDMRSQMEGHGALYLLQKKKSEKV